jgi:hypothetical protein
VDARDPGVLVDDDRRPEELRADPDLVDDRPVGRPRRHDGDEPPRFRHAARHPHAASERVLLGLRSHLADGDAGPLVRARREDAPGSALEQRGEDRGDLIGRLSLGEDGLGSALPKLAVGVDAGEPEIAIRQLDRRSSASSGVVVPARTASSRSRRSSRSPPTER